LKLVRGRIDPALQLVRGESVRGLERRRLRDELLRRAHFALPCRRIGVAKEEVAREIDGIAQLAAQQRMHGNAELLAHDVEAGELDRGVELRAIVVEARGGIADLEAQRLERENVVAAEIVEETRERARRVLAAAAHLSQADEAVGGLHFDDRPHEAPPMGAVAVQERRLEWNRDRRGANRGNRGGHGESGVRNR
jgi:hypothetical protein